MTSFPKLLRSMLHVPLVLPKGVTYHRPQCRRLVRARPLTNNNFLTFTETVFFNYLTTEIHLAVNRHTDLIDRYSPANSLECLMKTHED